MGHGFGVFLGAVVLILALAVRDAISGIDLVMIGWILAPAGLALVLLTAAQDASRKRGARTVQTTTHDDGSQTVASSGPTPTRRPDPVPFWAAGPALVASTGCPRG